VFFLVDQYGSDSEHRERHTGYADRKNEQTYHTDTIPLKKNPSRRKEANNAG